MSDYKNKGYKGKGKGGSKKPYKRERRDEALDNEDKSTPKGGFNNPEWYARNAQLLIDAASLPYSEPVGSTYSLDGSDYTKTDFTPASVPGVLSMHLVPTAGKSTNGSSALNIAARNIYSFVRHANAGHSNYDSPDLMVYLLAMDSLYSFYAYLVRAYGVMRTYSVYNRYLPTALLQAMGIDPTMVNNMADFRLLINTLAIKIGSMCTPASMSYFLRHMWVYSGIYTDAQSAKAQIYMYVPAGFYKYNATKYATGGCAEYEPLLSNPDWATSSLLGWDQIKFIADALITPVITDEDMNIMSGDILKAFGPEGVNKLVTIPEDYIVVPEYNLEVLSQIQNVTAVGDILPDNSFASNTADIWQDPEGVLQCNPWVVNESCGLKGKRMFTLYKDAPTPADSMVASRLTVVADVETQFTPASLTAWSNLDSFGSEICTYISIWSNDRDGYATEWEVRYVNNIATNTLSDAQLVKLSLLEKFDYHPAMRYMSMPNADSDKDILCEIMDVDNYTILGSYELEKMHDTAILSMFNVPQMGAYSTTPSRR